MPRTGLCTDLTCDQEIKQLYECHCCSRLICFDHLNEHVKISEGNNNERTNALATVITSLQSIIEKKLFDIQREKILIERAKKILAVKVSSLTDINQIYEQISQAIEFNHSEDAQIKVETALFNVNYGLDVCKYETEQCNQDGLKLENDEERPLLSQDKEYPMSLHDSFTSNDSLHQTDHCSENENDNEISATAIRTFFGQCPLIFNGAYGLNKARHLLRFCSRNKRRPLGLYAHFKSKHRFKSIYARKLVKAIMEKQNPETTRLFNGNEDIINHSYKTPCPFHRGKIELSGYDIERLAKVPCRNQAVTVAALLPHLKHHHKVPDQLARLLINRWKKTQTENDVIDCIADSKE